MIHTLTLSEAQAKGLADRLTQQTQAQMLAGTYLAALCDAQGLGSASLVDLQGTTLIVQTQEPEPTP